MKHFRSVVSLLLVFVLCFGMIPCAFADEITTPTAPQSGEGSASEAVPPYVCITEKFLMRFVLQSPEQFIANKGSNVSPIIGKFFRQSSDFS